MKSVTVFILSLLSILLIWASCRKIDQPTRQSQRQSPANKFFNVPASADPTVKRIAAYMKTYNDQHDFVTKLSQRGIPVWDKSPVIIGAPTKITVQGRGNDGGGDADRQDTLVFIPLVNEKTDRVISFIGAVATEDSIKVKIFKGEEYQSYGPEQVGKKDSVSAHTVALLMMKLESLVFPGRDTFLISDTTLIKDTANPSVPVERIIFRPDRGGRVATTATSSLIIVETEQYCITYSIDWPCNDNSGRAGRDASSSSSGTCPPDYFDVTCASEHYYVSYITEFVDLELGIGGGTGSLEAGINCEEYPMACLGGLGWHSPVHHGHFNPFDYDDTIRVQDNSYFRDSFPCTYALLTDSAHHPNFFADWTLFNAFDRSVRNHLTFKMSTTMNQDSANARTTSGRSWIDDNDQFNFADTIILNPYFFERMTTERKIQTILHESVHAYIYYVIEQYKRQEIDSNTVKAMFPLHWEFFRNRRTNETQDHIIIAQQYIHAMTDELIKRWTLPGVPLSLKQQVAEALAWSGLYEETGFVGLSSNRYITDSCRIKAIGWNSSHATTSLTQIVTPQYCSPAAYFLPYNDSLKMGAPCK